VQDLSAVTGACLLIRRELFEETGGFDEKLAIAYNDVDLCLKLRKRGYLIVFTPYAQLYHHESLSRGLEDTKDKQKRFSAEMKIMRDRWGSTIERGDPYYNPNLTLLKEDFSIKI
jgi:cellulose synthase/poly-beta-1,6-N-acetylglucosamine synthase-like glycosyltransferase